MTRMISQMFPSKAKWSADEIPDLSGKVFIVTGANAGIGYVTTKELLRHNAKVYVACRSKSKAEEAINSLAGESSIEAAGINVRERAIFLELDLSDLYSVRGAAEQFLSLESRLNVLIANAGVMVPPLDQFTKQGYDMQIGTNAIGHWYFTMLLLPALEATANEGVGAARVVTVCSSAADLAGPINWDVFGGPSIASPEKLARDRRCFGTQKLYNQSKLLNLMMSHEFASRYEHTGIVFSSLNPGNIVSSLQRHMPSWQEFMIHGLLYPVELGCLSQLYAATSPDATINDAYYVPWARLGTGAKLADDVASRVKVWTWMEAEVAKLQ